MPTDIVLTLTGPDRVGIVEEVTGVLLGLDANVGTSRMARLGGEFAILLQASIPAEKVERLDTAFAKLTDEGYRITTATAHAAKGGEWQTFRVEVYGADHEGIVHNIAAGLSKRGISIESAETGTTTAPVAGTPLFFMNAIVAVPTDLAQPEWTAEVREAADQANVDVTITAAED